MNLKLLIGLSFITIISCDSSIGIAPDKTQNDTYDSIQDYPKDDSAISEEEIEDVEEQEEIETLTDFSQPGPYEISGESKSANVTNCPNMNYDVYFPTEVINPPSVILGHGFARGPDSMVGWANHLSSWGVEVILPTLCHYNVFAGVDHEMNGRNMTELINIHGSTDVVYAGHSAGGLAAVIAASIDLNALGVLGLDTTDTQDIPGIPDLLGQQYAGNMVSPGFSIMGEPSSCNAENNGLALFRIMDGYQAIKITDADHCDFENPTDWICESQCENQNQNYSDEEIRSTITLFGTAAIMSLTELSPDGITTWEESSNIEIVQELE